MRLWRISQHQKDNSASIDSLYNTPTVLAGTEFIASVVPSVGFKREEVIGAFARFGGREGHADDGDLGEHCNNVCVEELMYY